MTLFVHSSVLLSVIAVSSFCRSSLSFDNYDQLLNYRNTGGAGGLREY